MKLEEYLRALETCEDERLTTELGVYDDWAILLRTNFEKVVKYFQESGKYKPVYGLIEIGHTKYTEWLFDYVPGTVIVRIFDHIPPKVQVIFYGVASRSERRKYLQRQQIDYNVTLLLHPHQKRRVKDVHPYRAMAIVIKEIGQYIQRERIPYVLTTTP